jgi:hypothetical protein
MLSTLPLDNLKIGQLYRVEHAIVNYHNGNAEYDSYMLVTQHFWENKYYIVPILYESNKDNKWIKCLVVGFVASPDNMCKIHLDEKQIFTLC